MSSGRVRNEEGDLWVEKLIEKEEKGMYEYNFYLTHPVCYSS